MLRNSAIWWSYGYLRKPLINGFEKKFRVPLDYRIHFALNCGAESCPAISFYSADNIEDQHDGSMETFLDQDVKVDWVSNIIHVSPIFKWYRGDFSGKNSLENILLRYQFITNEMLPKIRFSTYNWNTVPEKYVVS